MSENTLENRLPVSGRALTRQLLVNLSARIDSLKRCIQPEEQNIRNNEKKLDGTYVPSNFSTLEPDPNYYIDWSYIEDKVKRYKNKKKKLGSFDCLTCKWRVNDKGCCLCTFDITYVNGYMQCAHCFEKPETESFVSEVTSMVDVIDEDEL